MKKLTFFVFICLLPAFVKAQTSADSVQIARQQLDSTYNWFRQYPPDGSKANFMARWQHTAPLDKYGFQLSNQTWNTYRSYWAKDEVAMQKREASNPILYYLRKATDQAVNEIRSTKVKHGAVIWKLYNMGYIIKTKDVCFGIDINQPGSEKLVNVLDFVVASHIHGDHNNVELLDAMTAAGKPVYSPFYKKGVLIDTTRQFTHGEIKVRFTMNVQADVPVIVTEADLGLSAKHYTIYHVADSRSLEMMNPTRHINLMMLHIENAINVFDEVAKVKPDLTVYDHVMELGHAVDKWRWSYQFTYHKIKDLSPQKSCVLTWGERLVIGDK